MSNAVIKNTMKAEFIEERMFKYKNLPLHRVAFIKVGKYLKGLTRSQLEQTLFGIINYRVSINGKYPIKIAKTLLSITKNIVSAIRTKDPKLEFVISKVVTNKGFRKGISGRPAAHGTSKPIYLDTTSIKLFVYTFKPTLKK